MIQLSIYPRFKSESIGIRVHKFYLELRCLQWKMIHHRDFARRQLRLPIPSIRGIYYTLIKNLPSPPFIYQLPISFRRILSPLLFHYVYLFFLLCLGTFSLSVNDDTLSSTLFVLLSGKPIVSLLPVSPL